MTARTFERAVRGAARFVIRTVAVVRLRSAGLLVNVFALLL